MRKLTILLLCLIPISAFAQLEKYVVDDPKPTIMRDRGLGYSLVETGSGLTAFMEYPVGGFWHIGGVFDAYMLRDRNQIDFYDPYTGYPLTVGKVNNVYLLDVMFLAKRRLLAYDIDDSFRPFVTFGIGPVFGMNFPENYYKKNYGLKNQFRWTLGGIFGAGIDADVEGRLYVGFRAQYRIIPFTQILGERKNHSMIDIRLEIGQRF